MPKTPRSSTGYGHFPVHFYKQWPLGKIAIPFWHKNNLLGNAKYILLRSPIWQTSLLWPSNNKKVKEQYLYLILYFKSTLQYSPWRGRTMAVCELLPDTLEEDKGVFFHAWDNANCSAYFCSPSHTVIRYMIIPPSCRAARKWILSDTFSILMVFYYLREEMLLCVASIYDCPDQLLTLNPFFYVPLQNFTHVPISTTFSVKSLSYTIITH